MSSDTVPYLVINSQDIPELAAERARMLKSILIARATGGTPEDELYAALRREFMLDSMLRPLLPDFVRIHRTLEEFWIFIRDEYARYEQRRRIIRQEFQSLEDHLYGLDDSPSDELLSDSLIGLRVDGVKAAWSKALARRSSDPEGAITAARSLLESVIKSILYHSGVEYSDDEDLPKIYRKLASEMNLAPSQHTEQPIKSILGSLTNVVNTIGTLRNRLSDSHGRGGANLVRPSSRHASLVVNVAGAVASFLVETHMRKDCTLCQ